MSAILITLITVHFVSFFMDTLSLEHKLNIAILTPFYLAIFIHCLIHGYSSAKEYIARRKEMAKKENIIRSDDLVEIKF